jgi:hypothetical protein
MIRPMTTSFPTLSQFANRQLGSDTEPYEIVRIVSNKTLVVRRMASELDPTWKRDFTPGGFFGYTANNESQRWIIRPDPNGEELRIRLGKRGWRSSRGWAFFLSETPRKFHDFNF